MYRFLLPAFVMISAIVVLLAGALGGIPSLPDLAGEWVAYFTSTAPEHTTPPANDSTHVASAPPATTPAAPTQPTPTAPDDQASQRPAPDTLQQQATELQRQIAQRSRELASLNSSEDQARHELDALHQQRQAEQATISQLQARQKQVAAAAPQSAPAPSGNPPVQAAPVPPRAIAQYPRRQAQPASASPRRVAPYPDQTQTPRDDLENARDLLVSGRPADARQLLVLAQAQSALRPVTPDQPHATGGSLTATRISDAIRFLDRGNTKYALQAINMAMDGNTTATRAWPAYPSATSQGNHYPPQPVYR
ncbi:hypothetical protein [Acidisphaera sp. S103]|uniref:hypothetical protein n=1 Tax=Acidisphaera sp. S103 TaxID=1747223 RepID=UPI00131ED14A|nr:hypothetical protein [Acidisphaera sp. S103]